MRSRDALRARVLRTVRTSSPDEAKLKSGNGVPSSECCSPDFASLHPGYDDQEKKGSGTPTDVFSQPPHLAMRRAPLSLSLPLRGRVGGGTLAYRRSTTALTVRAFGPWAQLQARLPGTRQDVRSGTVAQPGERRTSRSYAGVTRARLSQSRERTSRTGRSAGQHDARSCPGAECIVPRAGTALAPPSGVPSAEGVLH